MRLKLKRLAQDRLATLSPEELSERARVLHNVARLNQGAEPHVQRPNVSRKQA